MQYSPKLKRVMEKIKTILVEEDIEGLIVLHHEIHSEILSHLETTNSCAKIVDEQLIFKLNKNEVGKERANEIANNTYNFISHFADITRAMAYNYNTARSFLKTKWNTEDGDGTFTSNTTQQN